MATGITLRNKIALIHLAPFTIPGGKTIISQPLELISVKDAPKKIVIQRQKAGPDNIPLATVIYGWQESGVFKYDGDDAINYSNFTKAEKLKHASTIEKKVGGEIIF